MISHKLTILGKLADRLECVKALLADNPSWKFDNAPAYTTREFTSKYFGSEEAFCVLSAKFPRLVFLLSSEHKDGFPPAITILADGRERASLSLDVNVNVELKGDVQRDVDRELDEAWRSLKAAARHLASQLAYENRVTASVQSQLPFTEAVTQYEGRP